MARMLKVEKRTVDSYWKEDKYFISPDQIFLYKRKNWMGYARL